MGQDTPAQPLLTINGETLEVVHQFQYPGSTMNDTLSLYAEISKRIGMAFTTLSKLTKRVWENQHLKLPTKVNVYKSSVISTLLCGSEPWTTYSSQERKLQAFHFRCLRRILRITWQDKVPNNEVLSRAGIPSTYTLLRQRCLRWLGHTHRMADRRIPKDLLYGELATGARSRGQPKLRFKDVCKRDMKACNINTETWEASADDRTTWKQLVSQGLDSGEKAFVPQMMAQEQKEQPDSKLALPHNSLQSLSVSFAADAALPELASSVTQDVVLHRNPRKLFHSLLKTEGCQQQQQQQQHILDFSPASSDICWTNAPCRAFSFQFLIFSSFLLLSWSCRLSSSSITFSFNAASSIHSVLSLG